MSLKMHLRILRGAADYDIGKPPKLAEALKQFIIQKRDTESKEAGDGKAQDDRKQ